MKKYYCVNPNCNNKISRTNWYYGKKRCQKCYLVLLRVKNPMLGKHHTEKTKQIIGKKTKDWLKDHRNIFSGKEHTEETKQKMRENHFNVSGSNNPMFGKSSPHTKKIKYKDIWMRSSWETKYAMYLDSKNIKWLYEPERFNLGNMTYCPDFYIPKWDLYIEIKGFWRGNTKKQFELFKKLYPKKNINLLMKPDLIELGIL